MAGEWQEQTLAELTDNFDSARVPVKEADRRAGLYPYYGASGVVDHVDGFLFDGEYLLIAEDGENLRTRNTPVAFLARGKFWVNNHAHIVRGNSEADTRFLMYALSAVDISGYLTGSTMPKLTQGNMNRIQILMPPLPEQQAIANILGTLDDKIELNRKMNHTLEAMAQAVFKSWFVNFDPVHAKAEGRDPGLPNKIADLFPDSFENSQLGEIPKGWRVCQWGDEVILEYGKSLRNYAEKDGPYFVYGTNGPIGRHSTALCQHPGIIIGRKGAYRGIHFADKSFFVIDTAFYIEPKTPLNLRWAYYVLLNEDINGMDSGSAIPSTSRNDFYNMPMLLPPYDLQRFFYDLCSASWDKQSANDTQSCSLSAVRDALLPKLISGELRVKGAERFLETRKN